MTQARRLALIAGALYLLTFVTSIPALLLKAPALNDPTFILGAASATGVLVASWLEILLAFACIGTALALYPIARRYSEPAALGFIAARILEAAIIVVGVIGLLAIVTLRANFADTPAADPTSSLTAAAVLLAVHDWAFLLGPGLIPAVNAVLLGWILYRATLVPRIIPIVGLAGAPLLAASATATLFGLWDQVSVFSAVAAAPIALWELSLGLWLVFRGFNNEAITALSAKGNEQRMADTAFT